MKNHNKKNTFGFAFIITVVLYIVTFCFTSCGNKKTEFKETAFYDMEMESPAPKMLSKSMPSNGVVRASSDFASYDGYMVEEAAVSENIPGETAISNQNYERKLIKNGNVTLQVQDLSNGEVAIENWCKTFSGYISYSSSNEYSSYFTVKIPSKDFEKAMESIGNFGQIKNRDISTQDVSEQYYDLQTRLQTKKILQANLTKYLERADNITDILKIEKELNIATTEVESMEGQLKRLTNQIDFSTISINLLLPQGKTDPVIQPPTFGENVRYFLSKVKAFFIKIAKILLYAVICGIPCLAIIAFLYWLLFGKLGLIKKLIKWLK